MSQAPSMPMYWDAYIADTTHLTTEEHGAYLLLLGAMWRRNAWVPEDDKDIARIVGLSKAKWLRAKERFRPFLIFKDGEISQGKLLEIWQNTQEKIEKNRGNGAKGGRPRTKVIKDIAKPNGYVSPNPIETIPEPEPEPEPDKKKEILAESRATDDSQPALFSEPETPDPVDEVFDEWNRRCDRTGWKKVQARNQSRKAAIKKRLKDLGGVSGWISALSKAEASEHLTSGITWFSFDWVMKPANLTKLLEGNYDNRKPNGNGSAAPQVGTQKTSPDGTVREYSGGYDGWTEVVR